GKHSRVVDAGDRRGIDVLIRGKRPRSAEIRMDVVDTGIDDADANTFALHANQTERRAFPDFGSIEEWNVVAGRGLFDRQEFDARNAGHGADRAHVAWRKAQPDTIECALHPIDLVVLDSRALQ